MIEVIKFDKFDIFCPFYTNEEESLNGEQYLIWQVSQSVCLVSVKPFGRGSIPLKNIYDLNI